MLETPKQITRSRALDIADRSSTTRYVYRPLCGIMRLEHRVVRKNASYLIDPSLLPADAGLSITLCLHSAFDVGTTTTTPPPVGHEVPLGYDISGPCAILRARDCLCVATISEWLGLLAQTECNWVPSFMCV